MVCTHVCANKYPMYTQRGQKRMFFLLSHDPQYNSETQSLTELGVMPGPGSLSNPYICVPTHGIVRL